MALFYTSRPQSQESLSDLSSHYFDPKWHEATTSGSEDEKWSQESIDSWESYPEEETKMAQWNAEPIESNKWSFYEWTPN